MGWRSDPAVWMLVQLNLKLPSRAEGMTCFCGTGTGRENDERPDCHKIDSHMVPTKPISTMTLRATL